MAVPHIHTGPAARCPQNLRKRFLRTYMPLSGELHQTGEATDICVGADYPQLQPKHIEKEIGNGQLHVYQSAFGCGYILRGTEPRTAPAADSANGAATAEEGAAKMRGAVPEPEAALETEICVPEAAPEATEADPSPMAVQGEPPQVEEAPEEKEAAPAVVDEILPPSAAPEAEEAAPAAAEASPSPVAAQKETQQKEEVPEEEEAAPAAADRSLPPRATTEGKAAPTAADRSLPPMTAPKGDAGPEKMTEKDEAGDQEVDESPPPAAALRKRRPAFGFWTVMAMLAVTGMQYPNVANGFLAHNGTRFASRGDIYSPPGPTARLTTTPYGPASGQAADVADRVGTEMECRALHSDEEKGGGYPIAALEKLVEGRYPPFNPDFLDKNKDGHE
jgi:hypothetical protein